MKQKIVAMILAGMMALSMTACGGGDAKQTDSQKNNTDASEEPTVDSADEPVSEITYQSILDEYSQKLTEMTPVLVDEYNAESAEKAGDINALAELSTSKIEKLAEISTEGMEKMSELMLKNGDEYANYEEWANKLTDVYTEQSKQLTDAYTASATEENNTQEVPTESKNEDPLGFHVSFRETYPNDVTGNWRLAMISEDINIEEYALNYYTNYFKEDTEIHVIVNFSLNTTTCISVIGNLLNVRVMEYVETEENDAKLACSGMLLSEYNVNIETGEIEKIQ